MLQLSHSMQEGIKRMIEVEGKKAKGTETGGSIGTLMQWMTKNKAPPLRKHDQNNTKTLRQTTKTPQQEHRPENIRTKTRPPEHHYPTTAGERTSTKTPPTENTPTETPPGENTTINTSKTKHQATTETPPANRKRRKAKRQQNTSSRKPGHEKQ